MVPILLLLGITFYNQSSSNVICIFESYNVLNEQCNAGSRGRQFSTTSTKKQREE